MAAGAAGGQRHAPSSDCARHGGRGGHTIIRVEEVKISASQVENGIELPLLTCMYLGDRFECLFKSADSQINLRAYSRFRLEPGSRYWLHRCRKNSGCSKPRVVL
jgi:iron(III) transport system ATP-binding protein